MKIIQKFSEDDKKSLVVGILSTVWIIWYHRVGKKFEEKVHKGVYEDIGGQTEATRSLIQGHIIWLKAAIILILCINLSACKTIEVKKVSEESFAEIQNYFCSVLFQLDVIPFDEYISGALIRAEVKEILGKYLIVRCLNDDYLSGYDIDVGLHNLAETFDIKPLDIVYICYDGMVYESNPPRIYVDAIFLSEKESVTYLWKQYIEYWPDYGIMLQ